LKRLENSGNLAQKKSTRDRMQPNEPKKVGNYFVGGGVQHDRQKTLQKINENRNGARKQKKKPIKRG